jgi:hypothetical protein
MQAHSTRIAAALRRNRLQQKDVSEALSLARGTIFDWVHGRSVPNGTNLVRLVVYLQQFEPGITERELLPNAGVMPAPVTDSPATGNVA